MEFPTPNFDPQGMMMPPGPPNLGWYGTPIPNRPIGMVPGGNGVNPFWTPGTQARASQGVEGQPSGARRVLEGSFNQVIENGASGFKRPGNGETGSVHGMESYGNPRVESGEPPNGDRREMDPLAWFRSHVGTGQKETTESVTDPVELFRIRCLREAEQKFTQGVEQMMNERMLKGQDDEVGSFRTVPSEKTSNEPKGKGYGGVQNGPQQVPQQLQPQSKGPEPEVPREKSASKPQGNPVGNVGCLGEVSGETLRTLELPVLSPDSTPIGFGDWLAMIDPMMADISYSSGTWWNQVLGSVRTAYDTWLKETPLGRLKMKVELPSSALAWPRTEKRAVNMLLQALPDKLRLEMISSRKLSTPQIMFRLYCLYQPGGHAERTDLLKMLTDFQLVGQPSEFAGEVRQWVRWLNRCEELGLILPDPMVLAGVLKKSSDVLANTDPQTGFRLASVRQELQLDNRPDLKDIKLFAEFLLAEAEDLTINQAPKITTPPGLTQGQPKPAVKMINMVENGGMGMGEGKGLTPVNAAHVTSKISCKFWLSDEGCKKGDKCRYVHTVLDPKENRCFNCSGVGHGKRECPVLKKKVAKTQNPQEKPPRNGDKGKGKTQRNETEKPDTAKDGDNRPGNPGNVGAPKDSNTGSSTSEGLGALLQEASSLMKALRPTIKTLALKSPHCCKAKAQEISTGLLDGGATNALRTGTAKEISEAVLVTVELAAGCTQLYQDPITGTLLATGDVEPIVPLRGLVSLGYRIKWDGKGCTIFHPKEGKLSCWLRNGCPVVKEGHALQLIQDIENMEREKQAGPKIAVGSVNEETRKWWEFNYPKVPPEVVNYMVGQNDKCPDGSELPWNRHVRRRLEKAKGIVIHLFAGDHSGWWRKDWPKGIECLTIDPKDDPNQDLHNPAVWSYVNYLVKTKRVVGIVGGPPCRSVSRLRHNPPGPRPVRDRNVYRFGLEDLTESEKNLVNGDSALVLKQLALYQTASEHQDPKEDSPIGFLMESPEDPAEYDPKAENYPSFWSWPEVQQFKEKYGMDLISFDQGCYGHPQRKPTSCMENLPMMSEFHGNRCDGRKGSTLKQDLGDRFAQTSSWSVWAPGMKEAVKTSLLILVEKKGLGKPHLQKVLDRQGWKKHIIQGHRPFRRDCRACILDMANGPPHRRRTHGGSSAWSMGVDVVQLVKTKDEVTGLDARYMVVATALIPVFESEKEEITTKDCVEEPHWGEGLEEYDLALDEPFSEKADGKGEEPNENQPPSEGANKEEVVGLGEKHGGVSRDEASRDEASRDEELGQQGVDQIQQEVEESSRPLKLRHVTLTHPVASRQTPEVLGALSVLLVKMRSMGIHIQRLHGDRAKELLSHHVQTWCTKNNLICTLGGGDDPANNGHVESEIGQLKKRLLRQAGQTAESWPVALRYVTEERLRNQLTNLGVEVPGMLPYQSSVLVKRKRWHDAGVLSAPYVEGTLISPSPTMFNGWVVRSKEGRILHVREALLPDPVGEEVALELEELEKPPVEMEEPPKRRIYGKTAPFEAPKIKLPSPFPDCHENPDESPEYSPTTVDPNSEDESKNNLPPAPKKLFGGETVTVGGEKETEKTDGKKRVIRKWKLDGLKKSWSCAHQGVINELKENMKVVPLDENEGRSLGIVVQGLQENREALENGLGELERIEVGLTNKRCLLKSRLCALGVNDPMVETETEKTGYQNGNDVLQTVTMSLSDVRKNISEWVAPMKEEYESLINSTQAVVPISVDQLDPNAVEFVPGKLVCVVKAGPNGGKKKCRGVICGNLMEEDPSPIGVYASGADGVLIRTVLRHSVLKGWGCTVTDIKTAFLLAPRISSPDQREVVVIPPRILVEAGVCKANERWLVRRALYGLPSSPACWAVHRDNTLKTFCWQDFTLGMKCHLRQTPEGNLWEVLGTSEKSGQVVVGHLLVYVDDMMIIGSESVRSGFMKRMTEEWKCTPGEEITKESWVRFSGLELQRGSDGVSLKISQVSYVKELLKRHETKTEKPMPMPKWDTEQPPEEDITQSQIRAAQGLTGELLWAAGRTRPDLSFVVSIMGQQVTKRPKWVLQLGEHVLGFLLGTSEHCLHYKPVVEGHGPEGSLQIPRHVDLIEAFSDISFAPNGNRSYQGVIVTYAGAPIQWEANRQAFCTMSTAESELMASLEAVTMIQSVEALLQVMYPEKCFEKVVYGDNQSALAILEKPDGPWRTRHLRLRANVLREKLRNSKERWCVRHQKGVDLVADLLTKPICQIGTWRRFWRFMEFYVEPKHDRVHQWWQCGEPFSRHFEDCNRFIFDWRCEC